MKFVMFSEGVGFFADAISHDEFRLYDTSSRQSRPIAAGTVYLKQIELACKVIAFGGRSLTVGIDSSAAYPDWVSRHEKSGLPPQCRVYQGYYDVFFFPFAEVQRFEARGVGTSTEPTQTSLGELFAYIEKQRR